MKHQEPIFKRIEIKIDKLDDKLDMLLERTVKTEAIATNNKATIKIILMSLLGAVSGTIVYVIKYLIKL